MKRFCTMFVPAADIHLTKDVGEIPKRLAKEYGYYSTVAGAFFRQSMLDNNFRIDKMFLVKRSFGLTGIIYLLKESKNIDILNLYHTSKRVWLHARLYKFLNPKGKVYIKLDCGLETCDKIENDKDYRTYFIKCLKIADLITVESEVAKKLLGKYDIENKIQILSNGFSSDGYENKKVKKEKIILFVGNLCHKPKGTDDLIASFHKSRCYEKGWKLILVGSMDVEFKDFYDKYLAENEEVREYIINKGFIEDRAVLYELYKRAAVFALPSYNENFSLAACEALANGCYLILSDRVTPHQELTCDGKYGIVVKSCDVEALSSAIERISNKYDESIVGDIVMYANEMFNWENIIRDLDYKLRRLYGI